MGGLQWLLVTVILLPYPVTAISCWWGFVEDASLQFKHACDEDTDAYCYYEITSGEVHRPYMKCAPETKCQQPGVSVHNGRKIMCCQEDYCNDPENHKGVTGHPNPVDPEVTAGPDQKPVTEGPTEVDPTGGPNPSEAPPPSEATPTIDTDAIKKLLGKTMKIQADMDIEVD